MSFDYEYFLISILAIGIYFIIPPKKKGKVQYYNAFRIFRCTIKVQNMLFLEKKVKPK